MLCSAPLPTTPPGEPLHVWAVTSSLITPAPAAGVDLTGAEGMEQLDRAWGILQMCSSQLLSYTFLACCLVIGMASGAPSRELLCWVCQCVNLFFIEVNEHKDSQPGVWAELCHAALCDVALKAEMFLN